MQQADTNEYERKEWMHPEDMDLENPSNLVLYLKHLKAYEYALQYVSGEKVLEIGCGSGYGNKLLASEAEFIYSADIDQESLDFARRNNPSENVQYILADVTEGLKLEDNSCDICICFQVIEHIEIKKMDHFLGEIKRIVKPGGLVLFTTPNRKIRLFPFQKPLNKYHVTEYTDKGLGKLLSSHFKEVEVYGMQGIEELKSIEIKRSKRSVFRYFVVRPIKWILSKFGVHGPLFNKSGNKGKSTVADNRQFKTANLWFDKQTPDDSIDLLAHCVNP